MFNHDLHSRELVLERRWAISTLDGVPLGYRHAHQMAPLIYDNLLI